MTSLFAIRAWRLFLVDFSIFKWNGRAAERANNNFIWFSQFISPVDKFWNNSTRLQHLLLLRRPWIASALHSASDGSISSDAGDAAMLAPPQIQNYFVKFSLNPLQCLFGWFQGRFAVCVRGVVSTATFKTLKKTPSSDEALHFKVYLLFPIASRLNVDHVGSYIPIKRFNLLSWRPLPNRITPLFLGSMFSYASS